MPMRGKFITFEGIDGCGKTTVSKLVWRQLQKQKVKAVWTCEPTKSWLGAAVKRGWTEKAGVFTESFLFMADRAEHVDEICGLMGKGKRSFATGTWIPPLPTRRPGSMTT